MAILSNGDIFLLKSQPYAIYGYVQDWTAYAGGELFLQAFVLLWAVTGVYAGGVLSVFCKSEMSQYKIPTSGEKQELCR